MTKLLLALTLFLGSAALAVNTNDPNLAQTCQGAAGDPSIKSTSDCKSLAPDPTCVCDTASGKATDPVNKPAGGQNGGTTDVNGQE